MLLLSIMNVGKNVDAYLLMTENLCKSNLSHDGQRSDDFFSEADLSHAHGHPLSRSWLVQVHRGTQEECTDAVVCRLKLDCGWVC